MFCGSATTSNRIKSILSPYLKYVGITSVFLIQSAFVLFSISSYTIPIFYVLYSFQLILYSQLSYIFVIFTFFYNLSNFSLLRPLLNTSPSFLNTFLVSLLHLTFLKIISSFLPRSFLLPNCYFYLRSSFDRLLNFQLFNKSLFL